MKESKSEGWLTQNLRSPEFREAYFREWANQEFFGWAERRMEKLKINRSELASRMGCSKALVSRWFRGTSNPTLNTMADVARCLGTRLKIRLTPDDGATP